MSLIRNNEQERLQSCINLKEFAEAMKHVDLRPDMSPQERAQAIKDHLVKIMSCTMLDKNKANQLALAHMLHKERQAQRKKIIITS